jgi:hypothetical protein
MNDTPEAVQHFYRTLLMRRSGSERLQMGCAMFDTARAFARASLRVLSHSDETLRVRLFIRTYGGDFDPETAERIAEWLSTPQRVRQDGNTGGGGDATRIGSGGEDDL